MKLIKKRNCVKDFLSEREKKISVVARNIVDNQILLLNGIKLPYYINKIL
jgi:hypothetical protein